MKGESKPYLDKGYVQLIDWMGDDDFIAHFARASFGESAYDDPEKNAGLVRYLVEHRHTSPLEGPSIVFNLKMPIFVMRQHVRHRTASLNELSLRYSKHDGDYYVPTLDRICGQDKWNKQGSGPQMPEGVSTAAIEMITQTSEEAWKRYNNMLEAGVARELARMVLPTNFYTVVTWKMDLHNLFHYLGLRDDPHAQWEIQEMAHLIAEFTQELFPAAYDAYLKYKKNTVSFSEPEMEILRHMLDERCCEEMQGLDSQIDGSKRRYQSFLSKLGLK